LQDAFNKQINAELYSSYLYLFDGAYFESKDLKGMANWDGRSGRRGKSPRHAVLSISSTLAAAGCS